MTYIDFEKRLKNVTKATSKYGKEYKDFRHISFLGYFSGYGLV